MDKKIIKKLSKDDWQIYKAIRIDALAKFPLNFGSTLEEEIARQDDEWMNLLVSNIIFGVFDANKLVGCCGFAIFPNKKMQHKASIWGMYLKPEYAGTGLADKLLKTVINHARENHIKKIQLACADYNQRAISFYQKHGFKIYARDPFAIKIGEEFFDDCLMMIMI